METKKTAVDYLLKEISEILGEVSTHGLQNLLLIDAYNKAKAIEKEQIIDARVNGFASSAEGWNGEVPCMKWSEMVRETKCEEYYNETYEK